MAQRPHGYWHRSYLATGVPKDGPIFQQDQQCYPILELCDFFDIFPEEIDCVVNLLSGNAIKNVLEMLKSRQDPTTGLLKTEETPADDAVEYPFHFSSHVLLWYTLTRLSRLLAQLPVIEGIHALDISNLAERIHLATMRHFVAVNPVTGVKMFAYLTDGEGNYTFYHDANDIPTLFALDWLFITTTDEYKLWRQTIDFGISDANKGGFYAEGEFGGLGSVHTKGPWPL